jgi:hypothetical protein
MYDASNDDGTTRRGGVRAMVNPAEQETKTGSRK